jgi:hypothetical protein
MRLSTLRPLVVVITLFVLLATSAHAQTNTATPSPHTSETTAAAATINEHPAASTADADAATDDVRRQLREQREEIERLQSALREQMRLIEELRTRVEHTEANTIAANANANAAITNATIQPALFNDTLPDSRRAAPASAAQSSSTEERLKTLEEQAKKTGETLTRQLGSFNLSGDIRLRYEPTFGQLNASQSDTNPSVVGNPLSSRQRFRLRARLAARGQLTKEFEWGVRVATGASPDIISTNQTLTDFFSRKSFMLDQAYITYKPARVAGLQLQGGKFEVPWLRTEMTIDNDINPEGFNESYTRNFKNSAFKNLTLVAWQLPFLERNSAFVLGADGRVNLDQSRRNGRDLALYGAQVRTRFEPTAKIGVTLSAADLYFSGTQFITPAQVFGTNIQFPVTFTIPATATTPAQTITTQVSIPREQLVSGNANLGVSIASNNAVNRDGRLSSGFNLVDLIGRLDFTHSKRWPVMLLFNAVVNTQVRDVVAAGAGGASVLLDNNENNGYWAEFQVGKSQVRGDLMLNYTFFRIEKDAVLTPFNFSDTAQQSDMRAHRFTAAYAVDPRVLLSFTGLFTGRPNGLLGVFGATPSGSLNRTTTRLQFDTTFRF